MPWAFKVSLRVMWQFIIHHSNGTWISSPGDFKDSMVFQFRGRGTSTKRQLL